MCRAGGIAKTVWNAGKSTNLCISARKLHREYRGDHYGRDRGEALRISGSRAAYPGHLENRGMNDETGETI